MSAAAKHLLFFSAAIIAGLAWRAGGDLWWLGPLMSLTLPAVAPRCETKPARFFAAFAYFAAGSCGMIPGAGVFFGHGAHSYILGAALWVTSSALLAAPWAWASDGKRTVLAILLDALPPLGLFGWISPLSAAGLLFPNTGIAGVIVLLIFFLIEKHIRNRSVILIISAIIFVNIFAIIYPRHSPQNIVGINTNLGGIKSGLFNVINRNERLIEIASAADHRADIVLLPETVTEWGAGTADQIESAVPPGKVWLIGVTALEPGGLKSDAIAAVTAGHSKILFKSPFPVPVSMWHPWKPGGYVATWRESARQIPGKSSTIAYSAVICYDQLLVWPWIEVLLDRPDVLLITNNEWWSQGTGIPVIQHNNVLVWSRLAGVPAVHSEND